MKELKPCPFCGGEAQVHKNGGNLFFRILCFTCWTSTGNYHTKKEAIEAWNIRVGDTE